MVLQEPPEYRDAVFRMLFPGREHPGREAVDDMLRDPASMIPTACVEDIHLFLPEFYQSLERADMVAAARLSRDEAVEAIIRMLREESGRQGRV